MKHLYLLLIFTLSFSVYSQGIFTYNFDDINNGLGFKTAIDGLILTADDGKCYRLKIIQGSSIELVEVNCH